MKLLHLLLALLGLLSFANATPPANRRSATGAGLITFGSVGSLSLFGIGLVYYLDPADNPKQFVLRSMGHPAGFGEWNQSVPTSASLVPTQTVSLPSSTSSVPSIIVSAPSSTKLTAHGPRSTETHSEEFEPPSSKWTYRPTQIALGLEQCSWYAHRVVLYLRDLLPPSTSSQRRWKKAVAVCKNILATILSMIPTWEEAKTTSSTLFQLGITTLHNEWIGRTIFVTALVLFVPSDMRRRAISELLSYGQTVLSSVTPVIPVAVNIAKGGWTWTIEAYRDAEPGLREDAKFLVDFFLWFIAEIGRWIARRLPSLLKWFWQSWTDIVLPNVHFLIAFLLVIHWFPPGLLSQYVGASSALGFFLSYTVFCFLCYWYREYVSLSMRKKNLEQLHFDKDRCFLRKCTEFDKQRDAFAEERKKVLQDFEDEKEAWEKEHNGLKLMDAYTERHKFEMKVLEGMGPRIAAYQCSTTAASSRTLQSSRVHQEQGSKPAVKAEHDYRFRWVQARSDEALAAASRKSLRPPQLPSFPSVSRRKLKSTAEPTPPVVTKSKVDSDTQVNAPVASKDYHRPQQPRRANRSLSHDVPATTARAILPVAPKPEINQNARDVVPVTSNDTSQPSSQAPPVTTKRPRIKLIVSGKPAPVAPKEASGTAPVPSLAPSLAKPETEQAIQKPAPNATEAPKPTTAAPAFKSIIPSPWSVTGRRDIKNTKKSVQFNPTELNQDGANPPLNDTRRSGNKEPVTPPSPSPVPIQQRKGTGSATKLFSFPFPSFQPRGLYKSPTVQDEDVGMSVSESKRPVTPAQSQQPYASPFTPEKVVQKPVSTSNTAHTEAPAVSEPMDTTQTYPQYIPPILLKMMQEGPRSAQHEFDQESDASSSQATDPASEALTVDDRMDMLETPPPSPPWIPAQPQQPVTPQSVQVQACQEPTGTQDDPIVLSPMGTTQNSSSSHLLASAPAPAQPAPDPWAPRTMADFSASNGHLPALKTPSSAVPAPRVVQAPLLPPTFGLNNLPLPLMNLTPVQHAAHDPFALVPTSIALPAPQTSEEAQSSDNEMLGSNDLPSLPGDPMEHDQPTQNIFQGKSFDFFQSSEQEELSQKTFQTPPQQEQQQQQQQSPPVALGLESSTTDCAPFFFDQSADRPWIPSSVESTRPTQAEQTVPTQAPVPLQYSLFSEIPNFNTEEEWQAWIRGEDKNEVDMMASQMPGCESQQPQDSTGTEQAIMPPDFVDQTAHDGYEDPMVPDQTCTIPPPPQESSHFIHGGWDGPTGIASPPPSQPSPYPDEGLYGQLPMPEISDDDDAASTELDLVMYEGSEDPDVPDQIAISPSQAQPTPSLEMCSTSLKDNASDPTPSAIWQFTEEELQHELSQLTDEELNGTLAQYTDQDVLNEFAFLDLNTGVLDSAMTATEQPPLRQGSLDPTLLPAATSKDVVIPGLTMTEGDSQCNDAPEALTQHVEMKDRALDDSLFGDSQGSTDIVLPQNQDDISMTETPTALPPCVRPGGYEFVTDNKEERDDTSSLSEPDEVMQLMMKQADEYTAEEEAGWHRPDDSEVPLLQNPLFTAKPTVEDKVETPKEDTAKPVADWGQDDSDVPLMQNPHFTARPVSKNKEDIKKAMLKRKLQYEQALKRAGTESAPTVKHTGEEGDAAVKSTEEEGNAAFEQAFGGRHHLDVLKEVENEAKSSADP